ncbi:MAG: hypothetical protein ACK54X_02770 [Burkholderiales bacterium]
MRPNSIVKPIVLVAAMATTWLAAPSPEAPAGIGAGREAQAVVGRPLTPVSVAGVARRTTRRTVVATSAAASSTTAATAQQQEATAQQQAATAQQQQATAQQQAAVAQQQSGALPIGTVVTALPAGCVQETEGGVAYQRCGAVRYRPAFQGNNLVYVVQ